MREARRKNQKKPRFRAQPRFHSEKNAFLSYTSPMNMRNSAPFEIHVHTDIPLRRSIQAKQVQEALRPMWSYTGLRHYPEAARSACDDEPGIVFDSAQHMLNICWTVTGDTNFRHALNDSCMNLNEIAAAGAVIEVGFFGLSEEEDGEQPMQSTEVIQLYVGPSPGDILQVQRNLLVDDVVSLLENHFETGEITPVINEIDRLFHRRFDVLANSLQAGKPPQRSGGNATDHRTQLHFRHLK